MKFPLSIVIAALLSLFMLRELRAEESLDFAVPAWQIRDLEAWKNPNPYWLEDHQSVVPLNQPVSRKRKVMAFHSQATSHQSPQGQADSHFSHFFSWSLIDIFVYWAGSASEGIVVPPPVYWTEQAHKHGVRSYGVVNLQPKEYGGEMGNLEQLLREEDGSFPVAHKLIEIASELGFDGWFINQETEGGVSGHAQKMVDFIRYFHQVAPRGINLIWYDSMTRTGAVDYQGQINEENEGFYKALCDLEKPGMMMMDYCWNQSSIERPKPPRRINIYEKLTFQSGAFRYDVSKNINPVIPSPVGEVTRKNSVIDGDREGRFAQTFYGINAHQEMGDSTRYRQLADHQKNPALFATNWHYNKKYPLRTRTMLSINYWNGTYVDEWRGVCHFFPGKPVIRELPFETSFNLGVGNYYFHHGALLLPLSKHKGWAQPQQQTAWFDTCHTNKDYRVEPDFTDAFKGGSSLVVSRQTDGGGEGIDLLSADYHLTGNEQFFFTYNHDIEDGDVEFLLCFQSGKIAQIDLTPCSKWCTGTVGLEELASEHLLAIGLRVKADSIPAKPVRLGQIQLFQEAPLFIASPFIRVAEDLQQESTRQLRLSWEPVEEAGHYLLFSIGKFGKAEAFIGQTRHTTWVVTLPADNTVTTIGIMPVSPEGFEGTMGVIDL